MEEFIRALNVRGTRTVTVTQSLADFGVRRSENGEIVRLDGSRIKKHAAFKDWLYRLKPGERAPRGRWFRGKPVGRPLMMPDEMTLLSQTRPAFYAPKPSFLLSGPESAADEQR